MLSHEELVSEVHQLEISHEIITEENIELKKQIVQLEHELENCK